MGSFPLTCAYPGASAPLDHASGWQRVCFSDDSHAIRVVGNTMLRVVRNGLATFHGSILAKDVSVDSLGKLAIKGHVEDLRSIDPSSMPEGGGKEGTPGTVAAGPLEAAGGRPGTKVGGDQPVYPEIAREQRIVGSVILGAEISTAGKIIYLFPVATSSKYLTGSAMDAVKTWRYEPALLNGQPVSLSTTITVNYNLRGVPFPF